MSKLVAVFSLAILLILYYPSLVIITLIDAVFEYNPLLTSSFILLLVNFWNDNSVYVGSYWEYIKDKWNE